MTQSNNILQELQELGSNLPHANTRDIYEIPTGYFEGLAGQVLNRIRAIEAAASASDELSLLSPLLSGVSKQNPYLLPVDYFDDLEKKLLQAIHQDNNPETAQQELESISPLLSSLKKNMPYKVPEEYFQDLASQINVEGNKAAGKLVSINNLKWFKYAAAAVLTGVIATTALLIFKNSSRPSEKEILAKFTKEVKKLDDNQKNKLADFMDAGFDGTETVKLNPDKPNEVKDLLKGISDEELKAFQEQNEDLQDVLLATDFNE